MELEIEVCSRKQSPGTGMAEVTRPHTLTEVNRYLNTTDQVRKLSLMMEIKEMKNSM